MARQAIPMLDTQSSAQIQKDIEAMRLAAAERQAMMTQAGQDRANAGRIAQAYVGQRTAPPSDVMRAALQGQGQSVRTAPDGTQIPEGMSLDSYMRSKGMTQTNTGQYVSQAHAQAMRKDWEGQLQSDRQAQLRQGNVPTASIQFAGKTVDGQNMPVVQRDFGYKDQSGQAQYAGYGDAIPTEGLAKNVANYYQQVGNNRVQMAMRDFQKKMQERAARYQAIKGQLYGTMAPNQKASAIDTFQGLPGAETQPNAQDGRPEYTPSAIAEQQRYIQQFSMPAQEAARDPYSQIMSPSDQGMTPEPALQIPVDQLNPGHAYWARRQLEQANAEIPALREEFKNIVADSQNAVANARKAMAQRERLAPGVAQPDQFSAVPSVTADQFNAQRQGYADRFALAQKEGQQAREYLDAFNAGLAPMAGIPVAPAGTGAFEKTSQEKALDAENARKQAAADAGPTGPNAVSVATVEAIEKPADFSGMMDNYIVWGPSLKSKVVSAGTTLAQIRNAIDKPPAGVTREQIASAVRSSGWFNRILPSITTLRNWQNRIGFAFQSEAGQLADAYQAIYDYVMGQNSAPAAAAPPPVQTNPYMPPRVAPRV